MRRQDRRLTLWLGTCIATIAVSVVDIGFGVSWIHHLGKAPVVRASDIYTVLFVLPFNLIFIVLWLMVASHRLPPALSAKLSKNRDRLAAVWLFAMPIWALVVLSPIVTRSISYPQAIVGWLIVIGGCIAGYRLGPQIKRYRDRDKKRAQIMPVRLPTRCPSDELTASAKARVSCEALDKDPIRLSRFGLVNNVMIQDDESRFVARPSCALRLQVGTASMGVAVAFVGGGFLLLSQRSDLSLFEMLFWSVPVSAAIVAGVIGCFIAFLQDDSVEFDFQFDRVTYGPRLARKTLAMSVIVAVQYLLVPPSETRGNDNDYDRRCKYQVNMVLDEPGERRINVTCSPNSHWSRATAIELARALEVPLCDEVFSST